MATVALLVAPLVACEGAPARSKPWRHRKDAATSQPPASPLLAEEASRVRAQRERAYTLRVLMNASPRHLNPMVAPTEWSVRIAFDTVFEPLIRYAPPADQAGAGTFEPQLAVAWDVGPGGREVRVDLRDGVTFHDGKPLTSADVQFSLEAARNPRVRADHLRTALADVVAVEIVSPSVLRVRLARPNAYVLRALAEVPILPRHVYEGALDRQSYTAVGTGPYIVVGDDPAKTKVVRLARNDAYWGDRPAIRNIEFVLEPDAAAALTAAKHGELDIVPALIPEHHPEQATAPAIQAAFVPLRLRPPTLRYLVLGAQKPPLDDARVREAVSLLVERQVIAGALEDGLARPVPGLVWPGGPGNGVSPAPPPFDPARAGQLLDAAGWRDRDHDGRRERNDERLHVALLSLESEHEERELVVKRLRQMGFTVEVRRGSAAVLLNRLEEGDFDLGFVRWRARVDSDLSPLLETGGALNFGRFSDAEIDRLLAQLRGAWTPAERGPVYAALADRLAQTWPIAPIIAPDPYGLIHRRVRNARVFNGWIELRALSLADDAR